MRSLGLSHCAQVSFPSAIHVRLERAEHITDTNPIPDLQPATGSELSLGFCDGAKTALRSFVYRPSRPMLMAMFLDL